MSFIGKTPPLYPAQSQFIEKFSGNGILTQFTLTRKPPSAYSVAVFVSGVKQSISTDYSTNGYVITFVLPPATGTNNIEIHHIAINERSFVPVDGSVTSEKLDPSIPLGAKGGGSDKIFFENDTVVTANYTITSGKNAGTFGPVDIADGVDVTIPDGSEWSIV